MGRLADKNILITGGNSGIGLAAAQEFDREGARVAICGLNEGSPGFFFVIRSLTYPHPVVDLRALGNRNFQHDAQPGRRDRYCRVRHHSE